MRKPFRMTRALFGTRFSVVVCNTDGGPISGKNVKIYTYIEETAPLRVE